MSVVNIISMEMMKMMQVLLNPANLSDWHRNSHCRKMERHRRFEIRRAGGLERSCLRCDFLELSMCGVEDGGGEALKAPI